MEEHDEWEWQVLARDRFFFWLQDAYCDVAAALKSRWLQDKANGGAQTLNMFFDALLEEYRSYAATDDMYSDMVSSAKEQDAIATVWLADIVCRTCALPPKLIPNDALEPVSEINRRILEEINRVDGCSIIPSLSYQEECEHVELLFAKLIHPDDARRRKGAEGLASYIGEQRCLPPPGSEEWEVHPAQVLADFLTSVNKTILLSVTKALAQMNVHAAPYASGALAKLMVHADGELRWEVSRALGALGPGAAEIGAEPLGIAAVEDEDDMVRLMSCQSLRKMGPAAASFASKYLAFALKDKDVDVQNAALRALLEMGPTAAPDAATALVEIMTQQAIYKFKGETGITFDEARDGFVYEIKQDSPAEEIRIRKGDEVVKVNSEAYSRDAFVRAEQSGITFEVTVRTQARYEMKRVAADALKNMGEAASKIATPALAKLIRPDGLPWSHGFEPPGSDPQLRQKAAETLAVMGKKAIASQHTKLARALADHDPFVQAAAAETLNQGDCQIALKGSVALFKDLDGRGTLLDGEPEPVNPADEKIFTDILKEHGGARATSLSDWLRTEMGCETASQLAEHVHVSELIDEQGFTHDEAQRLLKDAKKAQADKDLEDVLKSNKAHDLLNWLKRDMGVRTTADLALVKVDDLIEEGLLKEETALNLLSAAQEKTEEIARNAERVRPVANKMTEHIPDGVCWCGIDHGEIRRKEEEEAAERQRREDEEREMRRLQEEQAKARRDEVAKEKHVRAQAKRVKRKEELAAVEKKHKELHDAMRKKAEEEAHKKFLEAEKKRKAGMRPPAWTGGAQIYTNEEWQEVPLIERLAAGSAPSSNAYVEYLEEKSSAEPAAEPKSEKKP